MKLKLTGKYLAPIDKLLFDLKIKGSKETRSRSKLKKLVMRKLKEYQEDQRELLEKYAEKDKDGNPKTSEQGNYIIPSNQKELQEELNELGEEAAVIEGGEYVNHISTMKEVLENIDIELSGVQAEAYDHLLDAYEAAEQQKEGNE